MLGVSRTLDRMTQVLIRAELPVAGLTVGHPPTVVELTPLIQTLADDGKVTILERYDEPDLVPVEIVDATGIEFDATHGEAGD